MSVSELTGDLIQRLPKLGASELRQLIAFADSLLAGGGPSPAEPSPALSPPPPNAPPDSPRRPRAAKGVPPPADGNADWRSRSKEFADRWGLDSTARGHLLTCPDHVKEFIFQMDMAALSNPSAAVTAAVRRGTKGRGLKQQVPAGAPRTSGGGRGAAAGKAPAPASPVGRGTCPLPPPGGGRGAVPPLSPAPGGRGTGGPPERDPAPGAGGRGAAPVGEQSLVVLDLTEEDGEEPAEPAPQPRPGPGRGEPVAAGSAEPPAKRQRLSGRGVMLGVAAYATRNGLDERSREALARLPPDTLSALMQEGDLHCAAGEDPNLKVLMRLRQLR
eukprot:TRINITY_DN6357_c0_g1_i1.p1 TRINITY_DN6357_c0_g1~~TRINITY_DN6357_c0_g1_i1.p1  ORF type:complete len:330 (+),score=68.38 TRINITY_DN6357_c0_g1_i1:80-1069(+)